MGLLENFRNIKTIDKNVKIVEKEDGADSNSNQISSKTETEKGIINRNIHMI